MKDKLIQAKENISKVEKDKTIKNLTYLLADMCRQADEDCPSEYRTKHFRSNIGECYDYLYEIGYLKEKNVCSYDEEEEYIECLSCGGDFNECKCVHSGDMHRYNK